MNPLVLFFILIMIMVNKNHALKMGSRIGSAIGLKIDGVHDYDKNLIPSEYENFTKEMLKTEKLKD